MSIEAGAGPEHASKGRSTGPAPVPCLPAAGPVGMPSPRVLTDRMGNGWETIMATGGNSWQHTPKPQEGTSRSGVSGWVILLADRMRN